MNPRLTSYKSSHRFVFLLILLFSLFASNLAFTVSADLPKVGLIPEGPIDDQGFNQMAHEGLMRADTEGLVEGTVYQPAGNTEPEYAAAIAACVTAGNSLCVTVGFMMSNVTMEAATNNPTVNFAIMDSSWDDGSYPANLRGTFFAVDEAAYLAGSLAGLMSGNNRIGIVAGMNIPPVNNFVIPYTYGSQWANNPVHVILDYANNFGDEVLGAALAESQINRGADVIFGVGGLMGNGAIKKAGLLGKYCIGVDVDAYYTVFGGGTEPGSDFLLTSVLKRIDNAVYDTIVDHANGTFTSGTTTFDIENGGVGLAPYHEAEEDIPNEVIDILAGIAAGIANGSIDVWQPFYTNFIYLPSILR